MPKPESVRFASGCADRPYSGVWRLVVKNDDVFLGASKESMGIFKVSLHQSGVWVLAATQQSGATFQSGNRRAKRWERPLPHKVGVTRGPSVIVPNTSLGARTLPPNEKKEILWYPPPPVNGYVEFSLYFVEKGAHTKWTEGETLLAEFELKNGGKVVLLASAKSMPTGFHETVEKLLRENILRMDDPTGFKYGSFLWIAESKDHLAVPLLVDIPVHVKAKGN